MAKMMTRSAGKPTNLYRQKARFLSINAMVFYRTLVTAVENRAIICANVHMPKLIQPQKGLSAIEQRQHLDKIETLHIDFVLCSPQNFSVLAAIHTVDPGKPSFSELALRENLDEMCRCADLPLIRIEYRDEYDMNKLKTLLNAVLPSKEPAPVKNTHLASVRSDNIGHEQSFIELPEQTQRVASPTVKPNPAPSPNSGQVINAKPCPKCQSKLAVRTAKSGKNKGARYLVCTEYPICSFITVLKSAKPTS